MHSIIFRGYRLHNRVYGKELIIIIIIIIIILIQVDRQSESAILWIIYQRYCQNSFVYGYENMKRINYLFIIIILI